MPYIDQHRKDGIDRRLDLVNVHSAGELTYALTALALRYLEHSSICPAYEDYARVVGCIENTKLEFYRRAVAPYEDTKIAKNGDVYQ